MCYKNKNAPAIHVAGGINKKRAVTQLLCAEREGFEPPEPLSSSVFKTGAFDHSAIFPGTKVQPFFEFAKFL